jgi:hypothetical protein
MIVVEEVRHSLEWRQKPQSVCIQQSISAEIWSWNVEKSGTWSQNQCVKTCSCWQYLSSPCLENFWLRVTLHIPTASNCELSCLVFGQCLHAKCVVNNILVTDAMGFTKDSTLIWTDDSPHAILASRCQLPCVGGWVFLAIDPWNQLSYLPH